MYDRYISHLGVKRPVTSSSKPAVWRLPDSKNCVAAVSGSVLRSFFLVERNSARRVVNRLSAESSLAPISMFSLCSGGVFALSALYEYVSPEVLNEVPYDMWNECRSVGWNSTPTRLLSSLIFCS